jgi:hypothetical protein
MRCPIRGLRLNLRGLRFRASVVPTKKGAGIAPAPGSQCGGEGVGEGVSAGVELQS